MTEEASFGSLQDLVSTATPIEAVVVIDRGGVPTKYLMRELPASAYMGLYPLAQQMDKTQGFVLDTHRFKTIRIIASLAGKSAIPGNTVQEKCGHIVRVNPDTNQPEPAIDFFAGLPTDIFEALDEVAADVNLVSPKVAAKLDDLLQSTAALYRIIKYCAENHRTLAELERDNVMMQEVMLWNTYFDDQAKRAAEAVQAITQA